MSAEDGAVVVVGSIHVDLQVATSRLPRPGETVLGANHRRTPGGKGANQAVAVALLRRSATLIGRVGSDADGAMVRSELEARWVDVAHVSVDPYEPTGLALIVVDSSGANQIAVSPGASGRLSPADVARGADAINAARVLLVQLEVSIDTVWATIEQASDQTLVVLNPAPARDLPPALLNRVDVLVPNLIEMGQLSGEDDLSSVEQIAQAAQRIPGDSKIVVTLGSDGALVVDGEASHHVPGLSVDALDTTGAGDAFCGALAASLAGGNALSVAVEGANEFAASSTTHRGAIGHFVADTAGGDSSPGWTACGWQCSGG